MKNCAITAEGCSDVCFLLNGTRIRMIWVAGKNWERKALVMLVCCRMFKQDVRAGIRMLDVAMVMSDFFGHGAGDYDAALRREFYQ